MTAKATPRATTNEDTKVRTGKILEYVAPAHVHDYPTLAQFGVGTVWQCACGIKYTRTGHGWINSERL